MILIFHNAHVFQIEVVKLNFESVTFNQLNKIYSKMRQGSYNIHKLDKLRKNYLLCNIS